MARSTYVYVVLCGDRRDHVLAPFTVKHEMADFLRRQTRTDLSIRRYKDGSDEPGAIMLLEELLAS